MEKEKFWIKVLGEPLIFIIQKQPRMVCAEVMKGAGLLGYELLVEPFDFPVSDDECLDFVENHQTLYARRRS
jgi:hypothetical protein